MIPAAKALHWRAMSLAKEALELGARVSVVCAFTGLPRNIVVQLFCDPGALASSPGPRPRSSHWYLSQTFVIEVQSAFLYACFRSIRELGYPPGEALVASYKNYLRYCGRDPRLSFDRAFELVGHVEGLWTTAEPRLTTTTCRRCRSAYLVPRAPDSIGSGGCPFCKLGRPEGGQTRKAFAPSRGPLR